MSLLKHSSRDTHTSQYRVFLHDVLSVTPHPVQFCSEQESQAISTTSQLVLENRSHDILEV